MGPVSYRDGMDFAMSAKAADYHKRLTGSWSRRSFPAEKPHDEYRAAAGPNDFTVSPVVEELKKLKAQACGTCSCRRKPA